MSDRQSVERELRTEVKKTVRETVEAWVRNRHWFWLVLILVVSGGYVEMPNLPIVVDDWIVSTAGFVAAVELLDRIRLKRAEIKTWVLAIPSNVKALWRRVRGAA